MRNKKIKIAIIAVFLAGLIILPTFVLAECNIECETSGLIRSKKCVCCGECTLTDALAVFIYIADLILKYVGVVALLMLIFGGILWMTSGGNESQIKKGKDVIKYTFLGIVIIFTAWIVVNFMIDKLVVDKSIFQGTWWGGKEKTDCSQTWKDCMDYGDIDEGAIWAPGCQNDSIRDIQENLNRLNCATPKLTIDGCFGPQTSSVLSKFQTNKVIGSVNGSLDWQTYDALMASESNNCEVK